MPQQNQGSP